MLKWWGLMAPACPAAQTIAFSHGRDLDETAQLPSDLGHAQHITVNRVRRRPNQYFDARFRRGFDRLEGCYRPWLSGRSCAAGVGKRVHRVFVPIGIPLAATRRSPDRNGRQVTV